MWRPRVVCVYILQGSSVAITPESETVCLIPSSKSDMSGTTTSVLVNVEADAQDHHVEMSKAPRDKFVLYIEGTIGIGKSTMLAQVSALLERMGVPVVVVYEPVDAWEERGLLSAMYDGTLSSDTFQVVAVATRYAALRKALDECPSNVEILLVERSVGSDGVFARINIDSESPAMAAYNLMAEKFVQALPENIVPVTILLDASIATVLERVAKRARGSEQHQGGENESAVGGVSRTYLLRLEEETNRYYESIKTTKFRVDASKSPEEVVESMVTCLGMVERSPVTKRRVMHFNDRDTLTGTVGTFNDDGTLVGIVGTVNAYA